MLYESAEGSIGVLKDIARNPAKLRDIFLKAYEICGYDFATKEDKFPERPKASYDDLLSYYNQMDHTKIDRHAKCEHRAMPLDELINRRSVHCRRDKEQCLQAAAEHLDCDIEQQKARFHFRP